MKTFAYTCLVFMLLILGLCVAVPREVRAQSPGAAIPWTTYAVSADRQTINLIPALNDMHFKSLAIFVKQDPEGPAGTCGIRAYVEDWNSSTLSQPVTLMAGGYSSYQPINFTVLSGGAAAIVLQSYGPCTDIGGEINVTALYTN